jgi:DUF35 OB-fold domain, acyl-CoA-associated
MSLARRRTPSPPHGRVRGYGRETDGFAVSHLEKRRSRGVTFLATPSVGDCPRCLWEDHQWTSLSGRGTISSFIVVHRPQHPAFFAGAPYNVAIVELEEGIRLHTNVVTGCAICRYGGVKKGAGEWRRFGQLPF